MSNPIRCSTSGCEYEDVVVGETGLQGGTVRCGGCGTVYEYDPDKRYCVRRD